MMNENETNLPKCTRCGTNLPPNAPEGLCPRCVLAMNLSPETDFRTGEVGPEGTVVTKSASAPPPPPSEIAKLFPQLEILELLGRGGMGAVYKARQPRLDRFVALKIISADKKNDPQFAGRFEREARTLARLHHPNIVAIYDFGETQGNFYLLMEFVDGLTLRQLLQTRKLSPEEALAIVPKICEALQYAHQQGIVHRDIKPENILIDKQGRVKIADFGIAKMVGPEAQSAITQGEQIIGTPHYMAPEQVERPQAVDHRADIYSLGVVLYEMLTSELPLGKFSPPSHKVHMDVRIDEVVLRALEKEPGRRYQHASDVKTDMETISGGTAKPLQPGAGATSPLAAFAGAGGSDKTIVPAFLLAFFFGVFGAHRFYVGKIWTGFLQLGTLVSCIGWIIACATARRGQLGFGILLATAICVCGIWLAIDLILILCKAFTDGQGKKITAWFNPHANEPKPTSGATTSSRATNPPMFASGQAANPGQPIGAAPPPAGAAMASAEKAFAPNTGKIIAPGVGLIVAGVWEFFHALSGMILLAGINSWLPRFFGPGNPPFNFFPHWGVLAGFSVLIFKVIPSLLIVFGGFQMMRLRSYAWGIAAGILAVLSCSLVGLPIGIWALILLAQPDVREVFKRTPVQLPSSSRSSNALPWVLGVVAVVVMILGLGLLLVMSKSHAFVSSYPAIVSGREVGDDYATPVEIADNVDGAATDAVPDVATTNTASSTNKIKRLVRSGAAANFSKTFALAPGGKLTMKVDRGEVRIAASDESNVQVRVTREVTHASSADAARTIREHVIEMRQSGNGISITAKAPPGLGGSSWFGIFRRPDLDVHYEISVPRKSELQLETAGGDITVADLRGRLNAVTSGGNIRAAKCKSDLIVNTSGGNIEIEEFTGSRVQASTSGGDISADFAEAPQADCDLHSSGGSVTAKLPESAAITLDAQTSGGTVSTELSIQTTGKHHDSSLHGTMHGGGPLLKLQSSGGDISVLKR